MRATLLEADREVTVLFEAACDFVGIPLAVVTGLPMLKRAAERARLHDFLILDCSTGRDEDREHCATVVRSAAMEMLIVYSEPQIIQDLRPLARAPIAGIPAP